MLDPGTNNCFVDKRIPSITYRLHATSGVHVTETTGVPVSCPPATQLLTGPQDDMRIS